VLDGRDVGTVIVPDAQVKIFVTATPEVRAERRVRELVARGMPGHLDEVLADILARDERDTGRSVAPLAQAPDAVPLDTSTLSVEEALSEAVKLVEHKIAAL
jgi:cytidylate kinase